MKNGMGVCEGEAVQQLFEIVKGLFRIEPCSRARVC
jgi:hypothetical protein